MKILNFIALSLVIILFGACGGSEQGSGTGETKAPEATKTETPSDKPVVELTIEGTDNMKYNLSRLEVPAGSRVKLTLKNVGSLPKEAMGHNWTLMESTADIAAYATAAVGAKDNGYQPADKYTDVIIYTKILGPGESETIEFDAPAKGTYKYICTFPGHYLSMQGDFVVL